MTLVAVVAVAELPVQEPEDPAVLPEHAAAVVDVAELPEHAAAVVAEAALPVQEPEDPEQLPEQLPVTFPDRAAEIVPAEKFPDPSLFTRVDTVLALVAAVSVALAESATLEAVVSWANLVSTMAADALMSALTMDAALRTPAVALTTPENAVSVIPANVGEDAAAID